MVIWVDRASLISWSLKISVHQLWEPWGKGIYLVLLHRFPGVESRPLHSSGWSFELTKESLLLNPCSFNVIFFAVGCIGAGCLSVHAKYSFVLQELCVSLELAAHHLALCDRTWSRTPSQSEAQEQFKYRLSPNRSEATRTKQNFAGNGCGRDQVLPPQVTLNSLLKMYSLCCALMLAFWKALYWRVENKFKAHKLIKILNLYFLLLTRYSLSLPESGVAVFLVRMTQQKPLFAPFLFHFLKIFLFHVKFTDPLDHKGCSPEPGLTANMTYQRTQEPRGFYPLRYGTSVENIKK